MDRKIREGNRVALPGFATSATAGRRLTVAQKRKCHSSNTHDRSMDDLLW